MTIPYTYLIGWSSQNCWYYGCEYKVGANPTNLWKTYFTTSKYVKKFRQLHGEPDIVEVRKSFEDRNVARVWEHKVLQRLNAAQRNDFLNRHNGGTKFINPGKGYKLTPAQCLRRSLNTRGVNNPMYGKPAHNRGIPQTQDAKQKLSNTLKQQFQNGRVNYFTGHTHTDEVKLRISKANTGKRFSPEINAKKGRSGDLSTMRSNPEARRKVSESKSHGKWFNNGHELRFFDLRKPIPLGNWMLGKKLRAVGVTA